MPCGFAVGCFNEINKMNRLSLIMGALSIRALLKGNTAAMQYSMVRDSLLDFNGGCSNYVNVIYLERQRLMKELKELRGVLSGL